MIILFSNIIVKITDTVNSAGSQNPADRANLQQMYFRLFYTPKAWCTTGKVRINATLTRALAAIVGLEKQ